MANPFWTECAKCGGRVKRAPNRQVGNEFYHEKCVPPGRSVVNPNDPRVPGYPEQAKYTRRTWERPAGQSE